MMGKRIENRWKNQWIFEGKIGKNRYKLALKTHAFLDVVFSGILGGFGRGLGRVWEAFGRACWHFFRTFYDMLTISMKIWIFKRFWRGLERPWGGFWGGFGRVWAGSGSLFNTIREMGAPPPPPPWYCCALLVFSGLCWVLLGCVITNVFRDMSSWMLSGTCHHTFFRPLLFLGFAGLYWALLDFSGLCWPWLSFALPCTTCFNMLPQLKHMIALPVPLLRQVLAIML